MSELTTDRNHPGLDSPRADGMNKAYLVLSEEERQRGFVRPVRYSYKHVGEHPKFPLRDLWPEEEERYKGFGYVKFETYPESDSSVVGRFWTQEQLDRQNCGAVTTMSEALAETYARQPDFYGATFCVACVGHFPVVEFVWAGTDQLVGS